MEKKKELGAAQICIKLFDGKIIVRHTNIKGAILFTKDASKGDWNKIWDAIKQS